MLQNLEHQQQTIDRFKDQPYGALFLEPGLGKTRIMIKIAEHKFERGQIGAALVVTTKSLMLNWLKEELPRHSSVSWFGETFKNDYPKSMRKGTLHYYIVNIDALRTEGFVKNFKYFMKYYDTGFGLFVDESTVAKNMKAKRTKQLLKVSYFAACRFIASGFPVTTTPEDLYSQTEILEPGLMGYKNFWAFRYDYLVIKQLKMGNRSFEKVVGYKNLDRLHENISRFSAIIKAKDCLDLPPRIERRIPIEFTPIQEKYYKELKAQALTMIEETEITAANAITLLNRLLQICAGQIKTGEGQYIEIPNNRVETCCELIEPVSKAIIWCPFIGTASSLSNAIGNAATWLKSDFSIGHRQSVIDEWRIPSGPKYLIANQASAGHGLTLVESSFVVYYSNIWSIEHRVQSEYRTDRIGQRNSVLYTDFYIPGTCEEYVLDLLTQRRDVANQIMHGGMTDPRSVLVEALSGR